MTVIRPNSVSGITSITAQANEINVFRSNGLLAGLNLNGVNFNTTAGISTLAALKITGNLDVAGVLTYQDVTNVDSLGIGTFRVGVNVPAGQLDVGSNIKLGNAGVVTATSFVGSGANLTSLPAQATIANNADNRVITGGSGVNLNGEEKLNWNGQVFGVGTASPNVLGNDNMHTILSVIETSGTRRGQIELGDNQNVDGGGIGDIHFVGHYQNSGHKDMASITANASGSTSGQRGSTLSFSTKTNGTATIAERLRIDSNGKLILSNSEGIQLSAKTSTLYASDGSISYYATNNAVYINGAGASGWMRLSAAGTANNRTAINIYGHSYASSDQIDFRTNSTERLRINSSGHITIGTAAAAGGRLYFESTSGAAQYIASGGTNNQDLIVASSAGEKFRIDSSGRVGVNQSTFATSDTMFSVSETSGHCEIGIISKNDSGVVINMGDTDSYNQGRIKYDNNDNSLTFRTSASDRLRIGSTGYVGINRGTPAEYLDVDGGARFRSYVYIGDGFLFKSTAFGGNTNLDTGISINQGGRGGVALLFVSRNYNAGTGTSGGLYRIKWYYDGNNAPSTDHMSGDAFISFGVSGSNTLTINGGGGNQLYGIVHIG